MIKHTEFIQGSPEWHALRAGKPTAGGLNQLLTDGLEIRKGEMPNTYLAQKLAEAWWAAQGLQLEPLDSTWAMDQGTMLEEEVLPWLSLAHDVDVYRVGCITTDDGRVECSPDGIIICPGWNGKPPSDLGGIEIKCPQPKQHCKTLLSGMIPREHLPQIHGGMFVTGLAHWQFVSYSRTFPKLVLKVARDDKAQANIREAVDMFLFRFDTGWKTLCEMNGGPPAKPTRTNSKLAPMPNLTYLQ